MQLNKNRKRTSLKVSKIKKKTAYLLNNRHVHQELALSVLKQMCKLIRSNLLSLDSLNL